MADANEGCEPSYVAVLSAAMTEITLPDGYELVHYTLRRESDGHLQSYRPVDVPRLYTGPVQAIPTYTPNVGNPIQGSHQNVQDPNELTPTPYTISNPRFLTRPVQAIPTHTPNVGSPVQGSHQNVQDCPSPNLLPSTPYTISNPYPMQAQNQQLLNIPIRGGRERPAAADSNAQTLSAQTQKRHDRLGENGYTVACGVVCPELATPVQKVNLGDGKFYCPRCGSNYTRAKSVKDHFPSCVLRYGNPLGLRYTDHESMASKDAALHCRYRQSRGSSNANVEQVDAMTGVDDQDIKTEFKSAADVALESIESHASGSQMHSTVRGSSTSFRNQEQTPFSPDWRRQSETPNPYFVPAATPGYEYGLGYEGQTPAPSSHASRTPTPASNQEKTPFSPDWRRQSETPNPYFIPAATPGYEFGLGYIEGQTPAPWSHASRTPTPAARHSESTTPTPAPWSGSSDTPRWTPSEETGGVAEGDQMEE